MFSNRSGLFGYNEMWNTRALHTAELPSSNGIGDARSLARMYASCIGEVDGIRTLQPATVAAATVEQACGKDAVLMTDTCFGLGFMLGRSFGAANRADRVRPRRRRAVRSRSPIPTPGSAFGYVMNDLRFDMKGDPRSEELVKAAYRALGR